MTPLDLLDALKKELEELYADMRLSASDGTLKAPAVYKNELPIEQSTDESLPDDYASPPYIIVRCTGWNGGFTGEPRSIDVVVLFSVYCNDKSRDGNISLMSMFERLYARLGKNAYISNFEVTGDISAALTDEDTYPYFFGGVSLKFNAPVIIREDEYA